MRRVFAPWNLFLEADELKHKSHATGTARWGLWKQGVRARGVERATRAAFLQPLDITNGVAEREAESLTAVLQCTRPQYQRGKILVATKVL